MLSLFIAVHLATFIFLWCLCAVAVIKLKVRPSRAELRKLLLTSLVPGLNTLVLVLATYAAVRDIIADRRREHAE